MDGGTGMGRRLVIDGNAVYEVDEECMLRKQEEEKRKTEENEGSPEEEAKKREGV